MKWRSLRIFMQADFHASMKSAHKNMRVNCNSQSKNVEEIEISRLYVVGKFAILNERDEGKMQSRGEGKAAEKR